MFSYNKFYIKPQNHFIIGFVGCSIAIITYVHKTEKNKKNLIKNK